MRQVSPGRQRASVQVSDRPGRLSFSKENEHNSDGHGSGDATDGSGSGSGKPRTYPAAALWAVLVGGILLGLLFAGVISSFVGASSDSTGASGSDTSAGKPSVPKAIATQQSENAQTRQRSDSLKTADTPEARDVRILGCGTDDRGFGSARVLITNSTSQRATYYVRVLFTAAGNGRIVSDAVASVKRLPPGQAAPLQSVNAVDSAPGEQVDCTLASVSRF